MLLLLRLLLSSELPSNPNFETCLKCSLSAALAPMERLRADDDTQLDDPPVEEDARDWFRFSLSTLSSLLLLLWLLGDPVEEDAGKTNTPPSSSSFSASSCRAMARSKPGKWCRTRFESGCNRWRKGLIILVCVCWRIVGLRSVDCFGCSFCSSCPPGKISSPGKEDRLGVFDDMPIANAGQELVVV